MSATRLSDDHIPAKHVPESGDDMTVSDLTQKLRLYRDMAARARKAAEEAPNAELRRSLEELARSWEELIKEVENLSRGANGSGRRR